MHANKLIIHSDSWTHIRHSERPLYNLLGSSYHTSTWTYFTQQWRRAQLLHVYTTVNQVHGASQGPPSAVLRGGKGPFNLA